MNFAPLHIYSGYSYLSSGLTIDKIISSIKKRNYAGVGLSDLSTMSGIPEFILKTKKNNFKNIIGLDLYIDNYLFSFFVKDEIGYKNLLNLYNLSFRKDLSLEDVISFQKGLIIVIPTSRDKFKRRYTDEYFEFVRDLAKFACKIEDLYLGIELDENDYMDAIRDFARSHNYQVVAYPFIQYENAKDAIVLEITKAIKNEEKLEIKELEGTNYFLDEITLKHFYIESELLESVNILNKSQFEFNKIRGKLPLFQNQLGLTSKDYLYKKVIEGLNEKLGEIDEIHQKRLEYELDVINKMGYADYFLIVSDYVKFAKENNISVGPGRGSAAGSLISYALDIVKVDPIKYDLLFERFLNPERQSMPDIDIDFSDIRREEVIQYLRKKYGENNVAHVIAIQTIGAKQALRDIGRVYDYPTRTIDLISKIIVNSNLTLRENYKTNPAFKELIDSDKYYLEIVALASKIEGLPRQNGLHAAGIVINGEEIKDACPTITDPINGNVVAFEKDYLEDQGLLKMDLLGLRNLTIIDNCLRMINRNHSLNLRYEDIPYLDQKAIDIISSVKTMGVFQLESVGMKKSIREIQVTSFNDVVAVIALFRPGPMAFIPNYGRRKLGKERINSPTEELKKLLAPTYGIIVYQEQIMQIVQSVSGFSLGEADLFRRAISKKDASKMAALKDKFIKGAINNGVNKYDAEKIFALIDKFANYGFNKSHALSYAVLAMQMAYLKAYYPSEFYAAILENSSVTDETKFNDIISEIKSLGISIYAPDINNSEEEFSVIDNKLIFPLNSVKGLNTTTSNAIINERRTNGKYIDFKDFIVRNIHNDITDKQVNNMIDAGCFDLINPSRASLRANVIILMEYAQMLSDSKQTLFAESSEEFVPLPSFVHAHDDFLDNLTREYDALGIMISGSPLDAVKEEINKINHINISDIKDHYNEEITVIGLISSIKKITTKKDRKPMAFIKIYDDTGALEAALFPKIFADHGRLLAINKIVKLVGRVDTSRDNSLMINSIEELGGKDEQ